MQPSATAGGSGARRRPTEGFERARSARHEDWVRWRGALQHARVAKGHANHADEVRKRKTPAPAGVFPFPNGVGVTGFEPAASWSRTKRSTKLSYTPQPAAPREGRGDESTHIPSSPLRLFPPPKRSPLGAAHATVARPNPPCNSIPRTLRLHFSLPCKSSRPPHCFSLQAWRAPATPPSPHPRRAHASAAPRSRATQPIAAAFRVKCIPAFPMGA